MDEICVIGAGLGRTGTKSLAAALEILSFKTYHFASPDHAKKWAAISMGESAELLEDMLKLIALEGYQATCDQPTADVFEEQMKLYPNARVILTVRDSPSAWVKSWKVLMRFIEIQEKNFSLTYPTFIQWIPFMQDWKIMRNMMGCRTIGSEPEDLIRGWKYKEDPDSFLEECYIKHNKKVYQVVPPEKLLEFNVKSGWQPLCDFLQVPVPDVDFPFVNESADLETASTVMKVLSYTWIPIGIAVVSISVAVTRSYLTKQ